MGSNGKCTKTGVVLGGHNSHAPIMRRSQFLLFDPSLDLENSSSKEDSEEGLIAGNLSDPRYSPALEAFPGSTLSNRVNRMKLTSSPWVDDKGGGYNTSLISGPVTYEWLSQAEDARLHGGSEGFQSIANAGTTRDRNRNGITTFSVIQEFNFWRQKPELAEAVAAIKALTAVIQRSEATTMMGLEIELKEASEALKAVIFSCDM